MFFRIIFIWFITGWSSLAQGNLAAKQGVIDLTEWDLLSKPVLTLNGEYGFYWARDDDETSISDRLDYRVIPNTWDQSLAPSTQLKNGVPTFRLHVLLPDVSAEIGIVFREIAIVHKVLIGGQPVFSLGPPGVIPEVHQSSNGFTTFVIPQGVRELDLVFQLIGSDYSIDDNWKPPLIGARDVLSKKEVDLVAVDTFLASGMFIMAFYHFILFGMRRQSTPSLLLGIFLSLVMLRVAASNDGLILLRYFDFGFFSLKRVEYLSFYLSAPCFIWFLGKLFPNESPSNVLKVMAMVSLPFVGAALLLPIDVYSSVIVAFRIYTIGCILLGYGIIIKAIKSRRQEAIPMIIGGTLVSLAVINDILHSSSVISSTYMIGFGIYGLVFCQSIVLALNLTNSIKKLEIYAKRIERLNADLKRYIKNLDIMVDEKVRDIRSIMKNIQQGICLAEGEALRITADHSDYLRSMTQSTQIEGQKLTDIVFKDANISNEIRSQVENTLRATMGEMSLSFSLNSHLLINEFTKNIAGKELFFEIDWHPIVNKDDVIDRYLVAMRDVTSLRILQHQARLKEAETSMVSELLEVSNDSFWTFIHSCRNLITNARAALENMSVDSQARVKEAFRQIHTAKGLSQTLGLSQISSRAHELEDYLSSLKGADVPSRCNGTIETHLSGIESYIDSYESLYAEKLCRVELDPEQVIVQREKLKESCSLLESLRILDIDSKIQSKAGALHSYFEQLLYQSLEGVLGEQIAYLPKLADNLGKGSVKVTIDDPGVLFSKHFHPLLREVFIHLFKNSLDHGIESPHCRRSTGKSVTGEIFIKLRPLEENLVIEVWDDGQGLNIEKIRRKMNPSSAALTSKDLAHAIFQSGFSTKNKVNHVSGRGIGMDAVRNSLESHGASIHIKLRPEDYGCDQFKLFSFVITIPKGYFVIQQD